MKLSCTRWSLVSVLLLLAASLGVKNTISAQTSQFGIYSVGSWPGYLRGPSSLLSVKSNYAYVVLSVGPGQFQGALVVFDISDTNTPKRIGSVGIKDSVTTIGLVANYAYLFTSSSELVIVDIGNPVNPIVVRTNRFDFSRLWERLHAERSLRLPCRGKFSSP